MDINKYKLFHYLLPSHVILMALHSCTDVSCPPSWLPGSPKGVMNMIYWGLCKLSQPGMCNKGKRGVRKLSSNLSAQTLPWFSHKRNQLWWRCSVGMPLWPASVIHFPWLNHVGWGSIYVAPSKVLIFAQSSKCRSRFLRIVRTQVFCYFLFRGCQANNFGISSIIAYLIIFFFNEFKPALLCDSVHYLKHNRPF